MASLLNAIIQIQTAFVANIPGLAQVPEMPPEDAGAFPFLVTFPQTGTHSWRAAGQRVDIHTIAIELHVGRKDLPLDIRKALHYAELIPGALKTAEIAGEVSDVMLFEEGNYLFGPMLWGGVETVGFHWNQPIRLNIT